jgi:hypothetical protein
MNYGLKTNITSHQVTSIYLVTKMPIPETFNFSKKDLLTDLSRHDLIPF